MNNNDWEDIFEDLPYIALGENDMSWYVYDNSNGKAYELYKPSADIGQEYDSVESMIKYVLELSLNM